MASAGVTPAGEHFREHFVDLLPAIQEEWPQVALEALENTRGSLDEVVQVIADQTGRTGGAVREQLLEFVDVAGEQTRRIGDSLQPLEEQLEQLLDDLNASLRPKIEAPVRERPLLAVGIAAGIGLLTGLILSGGRRR